MIVPEDDVINQARDPIITGSTSRLALLQVAPYERPEYPAVVPDFQMHQLVNDHFGPLVGWLLE